MLKIHTCRHRDPQESLSRHSFLLQQLRGESKCGSLVEKFLRWTGDLLRIHGFVSISVPAGDRRGDVAEAAGDSSDD